MSSHDNDAGPCTPEMPSPSQIPPALPERRRPTAPESRNTTFQSPMPSSISTEYMNQGPYDHLIVTIGLADWEPASYPTLSLRRSTEPDRAPEAHSMPNEKGSTSSNRFGIDSNHLQAPTANQPAHRQETYNTLDVSQIGLIPELELPTVLKVVLRCTKSYLTEYRNYSLPINLCCEIWSLINTVFEGDTDDVLYTTFMSKWKYVMDQNKGLLVRFGRQGSEVVINMLDLMPTVWIHKGHKGDGIGSDHLRNAIDHMSDMLRWLATECTDLKTAEDLSARKYKEDTAKCLQEISKLKENNQSLIVKEVETLAEYFKKFHKLNEGIHRLKASEAETLAKLSAIIAENKAMLADYNAAKTQIRALKRDNDALERKQNGNTKALEDVESSLRSMDDKRKREIDGKDRQIDALTSELKQTKGKYEAFKKETAAGQERATERFRVQAEKNVEIKERLRILGLDSHELGNKVEELRVWKAQHAHTNEDLLALQNQLRDEQKIRQDVEASLQSAKINLATAQVHEKKAIEKAVAEALSSYGQEAVNRAVAEALQGQEAEIAELRNKLKKEQDFTSAIHKQFNTYAKNI